LGLAKGNDSAPDFSRWYVRPETRELTKRGQKFAVDTNWTGPHDVGGRDSFSGCVAALYEERWSIVNPVEERWDSWFGWILRNGVNAEEQQQWYGGSLHVFLFVCSILFSRNFLGASPVRITSVCATILRGIVRPCRWREFVESTIAKRVVETAQVNIKRPFHGCTSGLYNASRELICGKLKASVTNPYIVVLTAARAALKARRASPSLDLISEGHHLPIGTVVYAFHPIFPDTRAAPIELPVSNFKLRTDNPRTDPDVRKSRIKKCRLSV
jgi:hypothetical protein